MVNANVTPTFTPVADICEGETLSALPTTSNNGITGTWAPALNNTATTIYTFTPAASECAVPTTLTITVNPLPTAATIVSNSPVCSGDDAVFTISGDAGDTVTYSGSASGTAVIGAGGTVDVTVAGVTSDATLKEPNSKLLKSKQ